jgi:hypothetical protein
MLHSPAPLISIIAERKIIISDLQDNIHPLMVIKHFVQSLKYLWLVFTKFLGGQKKIPLEEKSLTHVQMVYMIELNANVYTVIGLYISYQYQLQNQIYKGILLLNLFKFWWDAKIVQMNFTSNSLYTVTILYHI